MHKLKLGSLFDGSGGFPLAGVMNGIEPVWASEIEPFPIRVTKQRFPNMKHLGSVTDINGAEIDPVDIITFGSPCQDLSVAGKQAGIHDGERSSLFFEAVRIIKEMREHDRAIGRTDVDIRPRFAVWENVPGAFSSNKGHDFQAVLQALCEIEGGNGVHVPMPSKGKWFPAGCIVGNGYSVAWRVYDAQYWGVPQRRKRIYLIADFASERAGEILFECEGVSGDHQQGEPAGKGTAENAEGSARRGHYACGGIIPYEESYFAWTYRGRENGCNIEMQKDVAYCLREPNGGGSQPNICYKADGVKCLNPWDVQSKHIMTPEAQSEALCSGEKRWGALPPNVCYAVTAKGNGDAFLNPDTHTALSTGGGEAGHGYPCVCYPINTEEPIAVQANGWQFGNISSTLCGDHENRVTDFTVLCIEKNKQKVYSIENHSNDSRVNSGGNTVPDVVYPNNVMSFQGKAGSVASLCVGDNVSASLRTCIEADVCYSIEGNTVDRNTKKNGCGYCQDVSPTLNTQDKHAVTYAIEGNGQRESHKGDGYKETDAMYTLNTTEQHAVAYGIDQQDGKGNASYQINKSPTLCSDSHGTPHAVCYGVDCRNGVLDEEKTHTAQAHNNGGFSLNCTQSVVYSQTGYADYAERIGTLKASGGDCGGGQRTSSLSVFPIENHPADSRCDLMKGDKCQTLTSRMGTGGNNVPMILEIKDERK